MPIEMYTGKSVQIIINSTFENKLIKILKNIGLTGYTQLNARGDGDSGVQDGHSEGESNVMFVVLVSNTMADTLIKNLNTYRQMGHHIFVYTHDAQILNAEKCDGSKPKCPGWTF
jgi:nitrogen regulatory protein PII